MHITETTAFLTPEDMAAKLRISLRKLHQMMKDGTAPKHVKLGGRTVFPVLKGVRHG